MKRTIALADNCIDVYYKLNRYYLTGNSIDFALNYRDMGGDVTEMTILGNDVFAMALEELLRERGIPLRVLERSNLPTGIATMDILDGDKVHLYFAGNAMENISLSAEDLSFIRDFDIVYSERWAKPGQYIRQTKRPGQLWIHDFSKRLENTGNDELLPYLDYAFFSYNTDDGYIRSFMKNTGAKGTGCVVAMLGKHGSLAWDGNRFYECDAVAVPIVNTVGAGDSYIAAFAYGLSLGEDIPTCMLRGRDRATRIIQQFNPYL